jgi:thiol-disulfide isomerase/thioredoxin
MRVLHAASCIAAVALIHGAAQGQSALAPNEPAPPLEGSWHPAQEPDTVDWSAGKVTLVTFWAEWCEPCKELMPRIDELYLRRHDDGLVVVGVHHPTLPAERVQDFLVPLRLHFPILRLSKRVAKAWGVSVLPASYLIDGNGIIIRRYTGATPGLMEAMLADTERVLDGEPLPTLSLLPAPPPEAAAEPAPEPGPSAPVASDR